MGAGTRIIANGLRSFWDG